MSTYGLPGISIDDFRVEVDDLTGESTIISNLLLEPEFQPVTGQLMSFGLGNPAFLASLSGGPSPIVLPNIGDPFGGGFFAGLISHTADGNPTHALIVAPAATGATGTGYPVTTELQWKTSNTSTPGANSVFDGLANLNAMVAAGIADHPAGRFCYDLTIGGFNDWYPPSQFENDIAYFNLKPNTGSNLTSVGINPYAVPPRASNYPAGGPPVQTTVALFQAPNGPQRFIGSGNLNHWCSNESSASSAFQYAFLTGNTPSLSKNNVRAVRAFRRIAL